MRRSCAPSQRKLLAQSLPPEIYKSVQASTSSLNSIEDKETAKENVEENDNLMYTVCYGRITTKKHKTWEGDGIIVVSSNRVVLKDLNGRILESEPLAKNTEVEEGSRIIVGNKEVELIDKIGKEPPKIITTKRPSECLSSGFFSFSNTKRFKAPTILDDEDEIKFEPLQMPDPPREHQEKFNKLKHDITKVFVPASLARILRPHQREGVCFLYECLMGYRSNEKGNFFGAILADEMGIGKTLQTITVCWTLLKTGPYGQSVARKVLIVAPSSLVANWDRELMKWLRNEKFFTYIVDAKHKPDKFPHHIPFMLISYEMLVSNFDSLKNQKFDILVCDEGHRLKNSGIKISTMLAQLNVERRIILTGTPIQNDLQEFHSLIDFVNPGILGDYQEYKQYYEIPIIQSQQSSVLPQFRELGETRAKELNAIIQSFVLRRTSDVINKYLPKKQETVVFCRPSSLQKEMLAGAIDFYCNREDIISPLEMITVLKKICNHPSLVQLTTKTELSSLATFMKSILPAWNEMGAGDSSKLAVVISMLENLLKKNEKIILVSYFTKTLDMLMNFCNHIGYKYCRLDGTTPSADRQKIVDEFNNPTSETFIFLLSAKAGGVGLNLIGASRLVLYDNDWNPASDLQAMSRIWRDGQKKNVFIYRLITSGTIEEKIFQRQIAKQSLSGCVVDFGNSGIKLSDEELKDLFKFDEEMGDICLTHEMIECECFGDGEIEKPSASQPRNQKAVKMNELMSWEHHKAPLKSAVMEDLCISGAENQVLFIFRNQTDIEKEIL